ncbi:tyrosine-type recombinase/integrase [Paenarthrobacter sp. CM16]|uniref:tyrosine-type recombinase/integrase n=1 Tax=Paenarthrobacter sp. CM16 TaxID=2738447 RepID=UPI001552EABF|nr:tyrosine-type recombinase/integrase [Paenarthrobacter sp. CM16]NQD89749.1 tyrosine-type recombinase/integrase [Paenarthrobacter sp. CM16]
MKSADARTLEALSLNNRNPFTFEANHGLIDQVPSDMRLLHYTRSTIPAQYLPFFAFYHPKIGNIHLDGLPQVMHREMQYVIWSIVKGGGRVPCAGLGLLMRELAETSRRLKAEGHGWESLMDRTPTQWRKELSVSWVKRTRALPNPSTLRTMAGALDRAAKLLWFAYDDGPWWKREVWSLELDSRIPRERDNPPKTTAIHWHEVAPSWLRLGAMFYVKTELERGDIAWATALQRHNGIKIFGRFLTGRNVDTPLLAKNPQECRTLMLNFLTESAFRTQSGSRREHSGTSSIVAAVRGLYEFMIDHADDAAQAGIDGRWAAVTPDYLRLIRPGDLPRKSKKKPLDETRLYSEHTISQIALHAPLLAASRSDGGLGDPQAMRILLLLLSTGRRASEICMIDVNPLIPVPGAEDTGSERIAKLRYQQTKIDGAPETIFIDSEAVEIVAEQQRWLRDHLERNQIMGPLPQYLFIRNHNNLHGQRPYSSHVFRTQLRKLVDLADIRDENDQPLKLARTHNFRHTKATNLLNAGVPLHVVQRYLGHTTPEMTMHYAQTLDATAKAEFIKYRKLTVEGNSSLMPSEDLYDLMALDARTDRVLPNGWCTLPPAQTCGKGNACLTCDLFVTDERFLGVHEGELVALDTLVEKRQDAHRQRTGEPMSENHVWLTLRRREQRALENIVEAIKDPSRGAAPVAGAGTTARTDSDVHRAPRQVSS